MGKFKVGGYQSKRTCTCVEMTRIHPCLVHVRHTYKTVFEDVTSQMYYKNKVVVEAYITSDTTRWNELSFFDAKVLSMKERCPK